MSPPEEFSPQHLRYARQQRGLTAKALAEKVGIDKSSLLNIELGRYKPSGRVLKRLQKVLGEKLVDTWRKPPETPIPTPITFKFESGRSYSIVDSNMKSSHNEMISPPTGEFCVFMYKGKDGIHHVFAEAKGGWTRTYTDAQLIGKCIKEVEHEQT